MNQTTEKVSYPYVLDHKPGFFLTWLLYRLFRKVNVDESMREALKQMQREGTVVYAIKYRSQFDYLLYHFNFRRKRLPFPKLAFDLNVCMLLPIRQFVKVIISQLSFLFKSGKLPDPYKSGLYERAIKKRTTSLIFLIDPKRFVKKFVHAEKDHLQFLIETQKGMERPIFIVPQLILYKKTPEKDYLSLGNLLFGYRDNPGFLRKIALFFRHHRSAIIDFGAPLNLKAYLESQPSERPTNEMAEEIRNMLIESIDSQKRVILGPIMKSRHQLKEIVLTDPAVRERIESIASAEGKKLTQIKREAEAYFEEIAADYSTTYVHIFHSALTWLWKRIFERIEVDSLELAKVREWARRGPLIFVPSHKSHVDYLVLNYILYKHHTHVPRIAAGKNLAFWPMGHIFRKAGAFFIRRNFRFRHAKLYVDVFNRYIKALLEEGHPIEFFIEGGRSRNGKLVFPKTGFLSILLQAHREGYCKDLIFAPTAIIYDRIIEESSYLKEIEGEAKEKESIRQMLKARRFLKKRYGKVYLRFASPFSLNEYLAQNQLPEPETLQKLAFQLVKSINKVTLATPLSLVATAILANHRKGFLLSDLLQTVTLFLEFLKNEHVPMAASLNEPIRAVQETLRLLTNWKVLNVLEGAEEEEPFYYVEEEKKIELEYYKNSILHFFIIPALVATALLGGKEEVCTLEVIKKECLFLKHVFRNEFVFDEQNEFLEEIEKTVAGFLHAGLLLRSEAREEYRISKMGFERLPMWAALAKTFIESYWIATKAIGYEKEFRGKSDALLKQADYLGKRFYKMGMVEHIGALSRLNFSNAFDIIYKDTWKPRFESENDRAKSLEKLSELSSRLYELSHFSH